MPANDEDRNDNASPAISHSPKHGGRAIEAPVLRFDLQTELEQLRQQPTYDRGNPSGRTLVKEPDLRIVLMALKAGGRMTEHHASGPLSIQVLAGPVHVSLSDESIELATGELLALEADIQHEVQAIEDSVFLLTIGRTTYDHVSDLHEPAR